MNIYRHLYGMLCYIIPGPVFMGKGYKEFRTRYEEPSWRGGGEAVELQPTQLICILASFTSCHLQTAAAVTSYVKLLPHFSGKINDLGGTGVYINIERKTPDVYCNECFPVMVDSYLEQHISLKLMVGGSKRCGCFIFRSTTMLFLISTNSVKEL